MRISLKVAAACVVAVMSFSFLTPLSHAGFVSLNCEPLSGASVEYWDWDLKENGRDAWMTVDETYSDEYGGSYGLLISGLTDEDPILSITKEVENGTGFTWVAYNIDLAAGPVTFTGTPTSDLMTLSGQTAYALDFGLPSPVLPGQTVTFSFDILIPAGGPFGFTLTQTPELVPEPASIALVGLAVVVIALAGRKRIL